MARYSTGAIILHWLIALALAFEIALGFAMPPDASGFALFQLHKSVGIAIMALTLVRLGWRLAHRPPPPVESGITAALAKAVHLGFYVFLILAPLTGWALVSTSEIQIPTVLFGLVELPHLPLPDTLGDTAEEAHELLAWIGIALFAMHVAGALRHQFLLRHRLMVRISPGASNAAGMALGAAVIVLGLGTFTAIGASLETAPEQASQRETPTDPGTEEPPAPLEAAEQPQEDESASEEASDAEETQAEVQPTPTDVPGPPPEWTIQPGGRLAFSVTNAGETIDGSFSSWSGSITMDPDRPETADIEITVNLASASVGDSTQDGMLRGEEFFDTARFVRATFRASSARRTGANSYSARGTLELRGQSRPQAITFRLTGSGLSRHVEGSATIARADFGIGTGSSGENLAPNVAVSFSFYAEGKVPAR